MLVNVNINLEIQARANENGPLQVAALLRSRLLGRFLVRELS